MCNQAIRKFLSVSALFLAAGTAQAEPAVIEAESGTTKTALLELYTSEGCSSCPPSDRFLNRIGRSELFPQQLIPLSFHVTYWDYIGWRDPFARPEYDQRQRAIAARLHSRSVYTPQLVLDGGDMRRTGNLAHQLQSLNTQEPAAHIRLKALPAGERALSLALRVQIPEPSHRQDAELYIALYENRLHSQVNAGENRGKSLEHDYVVRKLFGPVSLAGKSDEHEYQQAIAIPEKVVEEQAGLAVFVQDRQSGEILQALATPLSRE